MSVNPPPAHLARLASPVAEEPADVFLLGAGFSRAISARMPLLQDLADGIRRKRAQPDPLPAELEVMMDENLAHALSYLEQSKPWLTEAENLRHRALFLEFSSIIAAVLAEAVEQTASEMTTRRPDWLFQLIRGWHEQRCTVLTLNYDTLIETAAGAVDGHDGPLRTHDLYPPVLSDAGLRSGLPLPEPAGRTFRLLKLHGSTNWYYSGRASAQGEPIYFVPPIGPGDGATAEEHERRLRAVADKYPFLVPPIYDKSHLFTHETIRALWFEAGEAVKHARRIVCMGYSLPESDLTMRHFLRTTLRPEAAFQIVDRSPATPGKFATVLRSAGVEVPEAFTGAGCIERFVQTFAEAAKPVRTARPPR